MGLPSAAARQAMISHWLPPHSSRGGLELRTELDYEALAQVRHQNTERLFLLVNRSMQQGWKDSSTPSNPLKVLLEYFYFISNIQII